MTRCLFIADDVAASLIADHVADDTLSLLIADDVAASLDR
jgi:hypothetical protein